MLKLASVSVCANKRQLFCAFVRVCVCVSEIKREREREREYLKKPRMRISTISNMVESEKN
jgi:hypothetical protein